MQQKQNRKLRRWELALLLGVAVAALAGVWLDGQQSALADKVIRLHVIAHSDSPEDQALKLQVRDRILAESGELLSGGATLEQARAALQDSLAELAGIGAEAVGEAGYSYPVTASLEDGVWFPTKQYPDFALPAGRYTALRLVIGDGGGQNWWCVVFPSPGRASVTRIVAQPPQSGGFPRRRSRCLPGEEALAVKRAPSSFREQLRGWLEESLASAWDAFTGNLERTGRHIARIRTQCHAEGVICAEQRPLSRERQHAARRFGPAG